jgi:hypothetical protein
MHFALCKEQQHSQKTGIFCDFGVAEAPPGFLEIISKTLAKQDFL